MFSKSVYLVELMTSRFCDRCLYLHSNKLVSVNRLKVRNSISAAMASSLTSDNQGVKPQKFDYFLVLDFEATCRKDGKIEPQVRLLIICLYGSGKEAEEFQ